MRLLVSAAETVFTVESVVKGSAGSQVTVHSVASEASCGARCRHANGGGGADDAGADGQKSA